MKPETKVWMRCESIGRPADTLTIQCTAREAVKSLAQWILSTYMGSKIRIILARTEIELSDSRRESQHSDLMSDLESILNQGGTPNTDELDREAESI